MWRILLALFSVALCSAVAVAEPQFPRLFGMNIGNKNYDDAAYQKQLARLDIVILGFYRGWQPVAGYRAADAVRDIRAENPNLLLGQYTILNEARDVLGDAAKRDVVTKITQSDWWLRNARGKRVQWTRRYSAWEVNFTRWAKPDSNGERYPQWSAQRDYKVFFKHIPQLSIWYTDNVMYRPRVRADWNGDGIKDSPDAPHVLASWRQGYRDWWDSIREVAPERLIIGNVDSDLSQPEFSGQLDGAFLEALMGKPWSLERKKGWSAMMERYRAVEANLRGPRIVAFNVWGDPEEYQFFRYAFTSCLMRNGYFSFTDESRGYSSVPWFDEYDLKLGRATTPPPARPWVKSVWRRDFEHGVVLVNPGGEAVKVTLEAGWRHIRGRQAPELNSGRPVTGVVIPPRDGVVLERDA